MQREDVAIAIAQKARQRLAIEKAKIHPIPNKILVPLLEYGSIEDIDDDYMVSMWANLLASAATNEKVEPRFLGILKELRGIQAQAFELLALGKFANRDNALRNISDAPFVFEKNSTERYILHMIDKDGGRDKQKLWQKIKEYFEHSGVFVIEIDIFLGNKEQLFKYDRGELPNSVSYNDFDVLESLGLCRFVTIYYEWPEFISKHMSISYYYITNIGVSFFFSLYDS